MAYNAQERETVINFNDEEKCAYIYSAQRSVINRLDRLCISNPETYSMTKEVDDGKFYKCTNKKLVIGFRKPSTRVMTDEQKQNAKIRLEKARQSKNSD